MNNYRLKSKKAGSSLALTMMFFTVIGMVTIAAVGVTTTNDAMAQRAVEKTQATALAESGVQMLYDQICRDYAGLKNPGTVAPKTTIKSNFSGRDRTQGTYEAKVINVTTKRVSPAPSQPTGSVQYTHVYELEGTGTALNGTTSITRARFTIRRVMNGDDTGGTNAIFVDFPGAINSNTTIEFVTNQGIRTQDPAGTDKSAHIVANSGIIWSPASGVKETYINPNIIDIQGHIMVANQPSTYPVDMTKGVNGLGNPNGMKNYRSAGAHAIPSPDYTVSADEVTGMGQNKHYPDLTELVTMRDALLKSATDPASSITYSGINSSTVAINSKLGRKIVDAPAIVNGNLTVSAGDSLQLRPSSKNPDENVIFVYGDISNLGAIENLGVKVIVLGQYTDSTSATYNIALQNSPYNKLEDVYQQAALVSFNQRKDAIKITSNSSARYGNVFAAAGGIDITGSLEINGILTSGGAQEYSPNQIWDRNYKQGSPIQYGGGVKVEPVNGQSFVVNFVRAAKTFSVGGNGMTTPLALLEPIRADRLTDWKRLR
ncbi:MAG: hypothetical protein ACKVQS_13745 [Fimbriimonadaceae bacterium]